MPSAEPVSEMLQAQKLVSTKKQTLEPDVHLSIKMGVDNYEDGRHEQYKWFQFKDYYEAVEKGGQGPEMRPTFKTGFEEMKILEAVLASHKKRSWVTVED